MTPRWAVPVLFVLAGTLSCASNKSSAGMPAATSPVAGGGTGVAANTPQPTPAAPIPASAPVTPPAQNGPPGGGQGGPPGGQPGGPPPGGGRARLTPEQRAARRDSATAMRAAVLVEMSKQIAGYENRRAEDEFTNIQIMKDTTAANLLKQMDYYGRSLGVGCTYCHVAGGKWDEDTKDEKKTARVMINLVNLINTQGLSKLEPNRNGQTPKINCITCHRGNTGPGTALVP